MGHYDLYVPNEDIDNKIYLFSSMLKDVKTGMCYVSLIA
jgi:hypothetical protein